MSKDGKLTVWERLLLAAFELDGGEGRTFSAEDLVVAAWRQFPRAFGLRGHQDKRGVPLYPDSNRVFAEIMGSKPIRKRGHLVKSGLKTYALTASGRDTAARLKGMSSLQEPETAGGKTTMSRPMHAKLERLLSSRAVQRVQDDEINRMTFHDACVFWGITARSTAIELAGALADVQAVIDQTEAAVQSGASELRTGSADLPRSTPQLLHRTHVVLQERFAEELDTIRRRTDQRKV